MTQSPTIKKDTFEGENKNQVFEIAVKVIPTLTGILIFSGALKYIFYYNLYNTEIIHFVSIPEILKLFLEDLMYYFIMLLALSIFSGVSLWKVKVIPTKLEFKQLSKWKQLKLILEVVMVAGLGFYWIQIIFQFIYLFQTSYIFSFVFLFVIWYCRKYVSVRHVYDKYFPNTSKLKQTIINSVIFIFFTINLFSISFAYSKYYRLTHHIEPRLTTIELVSGEIIPAFSKEYYIGSTDNYLFTFNDSTFQTRIIKMLDVKIIKTQSGKEKRLIPFIN